MKALLSKDRALGLKTKARWLIYNCIRLWLVRISKNLIISCHTHNLSWQITYIYVWFEMRKLRPRASLLYHFLKSTGVRVKIPDLLPTQLSKQQYPLSRNRNKNPWPANLTGMFVVRSNEIYMNMLWKCHNTLYKKKKKRKRRKESNLLRSSNSWITGGIHLPSSPVFIPLAKVNGGENKNNVL